MLVKEAYAGADTALPRLPVLDLAFEVAPISRSTTYLRDRELLREGETWLERDNQL